MHPRTDGTPVPLQSKQVQAKPATRRARSLTHKDPAQVPLHDALHAVADAVRRRIIRELAASPEWSRACGTFDLGISKATRSHHFSVLRQAGLLEQRDTGPRRLNRLRRTEFDAAFPGLLDLVLTSDTSESDRS